MSHLLSRRARLLLFLPPTFRRRREEKKTTLQVAAKMGDALCSVATTSARSLQMSERGSGELIAGVATRFLRYRPTRMQYSVDALSG